MSILVDKDTRLVVQGMTGSVGQFHTEQMLAYGTNVVAGCTPGKGGTSLMDVPVYDTMREVVKQTGANASCIFVPPPFAADAILEAVDAGIRTVGKYQDADGNWRFTLNGEKIFHWGPLDQGWWPDGLRLSIQQT